MKNTSPLNRFPDPEKNSSVVYHDFSRQIEELSIDLHKDKRTKPIHENSYKNPSISDYSDLDKISDIPIANKPHIKNPSTISFDPSFKFNQSNFLKNIDSSENYQRILEIVEAEKAKLQKKLQDLNELYSAEKFLASQAISDLKEKNFHLGNLYKSAQKELESEQAKVKESHQIVLANEKMLDLEIAEVHEKASSDKEKFFEEISEFYKNKIDYVEKDYEMACNQIEELQKEIEKIEVISKIHKERDENFAKINSVALNKVKGLEVRFRQDKLMRRESELSNLMEELEILSKLQAERNEGQEELQRKYENALQVIEEKEKKNQEYNAVLIRLQDFEKTQQLYETLVSYIENTLKGLDLQCESSSQYTVTRSSKPRIDNFPPLKNLISFQIQEITIKTLVESFKTKYIKSLNELKKMKEYTKKKVAGEENTQKFDLENSENQEIINDLVLERKKSQQLEDLLQSEVNIEFDKNKAKCVCLAEEVKKLLETMENMKKDSEIEKNDTKNEYENRLKIIIEENQKLVSELNSKKIDFEIMRNELNLTLSKHQELVEKNDAILGQIKLYQSQLKDVQLERNQILEKNRFLILENENLKNAHEATTESLREKEKEVASLTEEIKEIRSDFILLIEESEKSANKALYIESLLKDSNPDLSQSAFSSISLKVNLDILTEKMEKALSENSLLISKLKSTTVMLIQDENKNLEKLLSSEKEKNQEIADLFTSIDYKLLKEKEIIRLKSEINSEIEKCNGFYLEKIKLEEELQKFKNDNSVIQYKQVVNELSTCISELIANPI